MVFDRLLEAGRIAIRGSSRRTYKVGAIGQGRDGRWVHARNESVAVPTPEVHAEARLCKRLGKGAEVVYVARYSIGMQGLAMSKPCVNCEAKLRAYGVKKVIYTTGPDTFEVMILN